MFLPRTSKASVSLYVSLGVTQNASQDDIKSAYKLLHIKYTKTGAKRKLKEVEKAYSILGDPSKRAMYDKHGSVKWWAKIQKPFSPEAMDKQGPVMKGLLTFCFTTTCCCFCYCCHHCCGTCQSPTCDHDDDEIYIRTNFPEYLTQGSTSSTFFRRRQHKEIKQAARRRRRDNLFAKRGQQKSEDNSEQDEQECEVKGDDANEKTDGNDNPIKRTNRSLISKDSGYDLGVDNNGYVNDLDGVSINDSEGFGEEIELDQASIEVHEIENQGNSVDQGNSPSSDTSNDLKESNLDEIENQENSEQENSSSSETSNDLTESNVDEIENQENSDQENSPSPSSDISNDVKDCSLDCL
ncbi:uncharacterized protein LOC100893833 [Strongylocentrotus purpuratus]|uniref:J domain-containing protein n=1 Tax=Strongylocentrotus purpuratus TaxID=7668 RepID=A0A7M7GPI1_STRPU|nr:uncharacterized protein LOC100893833 [Strongylocentrotus purpuratus]|eukprot:XP_003725839.1 PREDICTED: uncharacterized protein LOC100893833 [Strongylocentrotus purpuratus]